MDKIITKKNIGLGLTVLGTLLYIHIIIGPAIAAGLLVIWYSALGVAALAALTSAALGVRKAISAWQISTAEVEAARAETKIRARHIVAFGRDQQVFEFDGDNTPVRALHLTPRARFNGPTIVEPKPHELAVFQIFHQPTKAKGSATPALLPSPVLTSLPKLVRIEDMVQPDNVSLTRLVLGVGAGGEVIRGSLKELSHIGVGGTSLWGKSIFLQSLLYQILLAKEKTEVYLGDIGGTTFIDFNISYADDIASTEKMCGYLWDKVMERKALYQATGQGIRSLDMYNQITGAELPYIVVFFDEVTVLMSQSKTLTKSLSEIVTYAAKFGVQLVLSGQNWKTTAVDSTIRDQFSSRFQFKAMDRTQGSILIKDSEADGINVKGRVCAYLPEQGKINFQAPHIKVKTIQALAAQTPGPQPNGVQLTPPLQPEAKPTDSEQAIIDAWNQHRAFPKMHRELTGGSKPGGTDYTGYKTTLTKFGIKWTP